MVTPGHLLVLPYEHVTDAGAVPLLSALTMAAASELVAEPPSASVSTSQGRPATQSISHLHLYVLPRRADDGLVLPWSPPLGAHADKV
ncbi:HIT family protein [Streptomyces sp. NRRL S-378]|uniref:HIT family protein n=1 Tax=Streptomyces sp. NRRL S-378 TaxID=1463904 RepID=UPI00056A142F|nr:HIT domain-containing protein [Streptomyces sp. NRRL S-378]